MAGDVKQIMATDKVEYDCRRSQPEACIRLALTQDQEELSLPREAEKHYYLKHSWNILYYFSLLQTKKNHRKMSYEHKASILIF